MLQLIDCDLMLPHAGWKPALLGRLAGEAISTHMRERIRYAKVWFNPFRQIMDVDDDHINNECIAVM